LIRICRNGFLGLFVQTTVQKAKAWHMSFDEFAHIQASSAGIVCVEITAPDAHDMLIAFARLQRGATLAAAMRLARLAYFDVP
jgi:hypothetical protein